MMNTGEVKKRKTPRTTWFMVHKQFKFETHFSIDECIAQVKRLENREDAAVLTRNMTAVEFELNLVSDLISPSKPATLVVNLFNHTVYIQATLSPNTDGGTLVEGKASALLFPQNVVVYIMGIILLAVLVLLAASFLSEVFSQDVRTGSRMTDYAFLTVVLLTPFLLSIIFSLIERNLFLRFLADLLTGEIDRRKSP